MKESPEYLTWRGRKGQAAFRKATTPEQRSAWGRIPRRRKSVRERFEAKYITEPNSGCWLWIGSGRNVDDYGAFQIGKRAYLALAGENLEKWSAKEGRRRCRICRNSRYRARYHAQRRTAHV